MAPAWPPLVVAAVAAWRHLDETGDPVEAGRRPHRGSVPAMSQDPEVGAPSPSSPLTASRSPRRRSGCGPVRPVDDVIRAVEGLEDRPIEEHVGVFESAQVQLRRALDDPGEDVAGPDAGAPEGD